MTSNESLVETIRNYLESGVDLLLSDDDCRTIIKALEREQKIVETIDFAIETSDGNTEYFVGLRNGMRYVKSLIDGEEPQFESCAEQEPKTDRIEYGTDGNPYKLSISNGKEYEQKSCEDCIFKNEWQKIGKLISVVLEKQTEPKMGHWIYTLEDWNKWECSECGFTKRTDVHITLGYKFCPNCGCRMENNEN